MTTSCWGHTDSLYSSMCGQDPLFQLLRNVELTNQATAIMRQLPAPIGLSSKTLVFVFHEEAGDDLLWARRRQPSNTAIGRLPCGALLWGEGFSFALDEVVKRVGAIIRTVVWPGLNTCVPPFRGQMTEIVCSRLWCR